MSKKMWIAVSVAIIVVATWAVWMHFRESETPHGFASGNGRLEATEIDIATKLPGRIAEIMADEGDTVKADQVVARMDMKSLEAQLRKAEAEVNLAKSEHESTMATVEKCANEFEFSKKELDRFRNLYQKDAISQEHLDQDLTKMKTARASCGEAEAGLARAEAAIKASIAETERLRVEIEDSVLKSPRKARVQYRLAEPGEVLPAGGKILTVIDLNDMYMTFFLPEAEAGKVLIGADARIVLDAAPDHSVRAKISFVAAKAQFTPKQVETSTEREKLVFRIKANVLETDSPLLKPGMPGVVYVRIDRDAQWPEHLR